MGRIAIKIHKKFDATDKLMGRLYLNVYASISVYKEPFQSLPDKLLEAYNTAALVGDVEHAIACLSLYTSFSIFVNAQQLAWNSTETRDDGKDHCYTAFSGAQAA